MAQAAVLDKLAAIPAAIPRTLAVTTADSTTTKLQHWLDLLKTGDSQAHVEMIGHSAERLRALARRMLRGYPGVRSQEQTDDVFQGAMLRLHRALADVTLVDLRHFYSLAALQIRRELLDLAKRRPADPLPVEYPVTDDEQPDGLAEWTEFHKLVEGLPEQEIVNLLWYHDLSQAEAAELLGLSLRTVTRRWQAARLRLQRVLDKHGHD